MQKDSKLLAHPAKAATEVGVYGGSEIAEPSSGSHERLTNCCKVRASSLDLRQLIGLREKKTSLPTSQLMGGRGEVYLLPGFKKRLKGFTSTLRTQLTKS